MERTELQRVVQDALRRHALDNRGLLSPARLSQVGGALADLLLDRGGQPAEQAATLFSQGLALSSIMAAGVGLQRALLAAQEPDSALYVAEALAQLAAAYNQVEVMAVRHEQEQMRDAIDRALSAEREQATRLTSLVQELSTPIVPVYDGILVLPLVGSIDSRRALNIMEQLLNSISEYQADSVIIDITGVAMVDTSVAQHLLQTARAAGLLGSTVILVGISAEIAQTMTQLGVELGGVPTLSNLQSGILYALQRHGLSIARLEARSARAL